MATFYGTDDIDRFRGAHSVGDVFIFAASNFTIIPNTIYTDRVHGGGLSPLDPIDRLMITTGGWVSLTLFFFADLSNLSGIEVVELSDEGNTVSVSVEVFNQSTTGQFDIIGGSGDDNLVLSYPDWGYQEKPTIVTFRGGDGNDTSNVTLFAYDSAYGDAGNDVLSGGAGYLDGGTGDDMLSSYRAAVILGGEGDDVLQGAAGSTLDGGDGLDYVVAVDDTVLPAGVTMLNIEGIAVKRIVCTIEALSPFTYIKGIEPYNNYNHAHFALVGGGTIDFNNFVIDADRLFVSLFGSEEDYILTAGSTPISLIGGMGTDHVKGGVANDELDGERGNDILEGGGGDDRLTGGRGSDVLRGGTGNDYFEVETAAPASGIETYDQYFGDGGDDTFNLSGPLFGPVSGLIDGGTGKDTVMAARNGDVSLFELTNVEVLIGDLDHRYIRLTTESLANVGVIDLGIGPTEYATQMRVAVVGGGVVDLRGKMKDTSEGVRIEVWSDDDFRLLGTGFADSMTAGSGHDDMFGRAGNDSFFSSQFADLSIPDKAYGDGGNDSFHGFSNGESLYGGAGNDSFYGCYCNAYGGKGYDTFYAQGILLDGNYVGIEALVATSNVLTATAAALAQFRTIDFMYGNVSPAWLRVNGSEYFDLSRSSHGYDVKSPEAIIGLNFKASNFIDDIELTAFDDKVDAAGGDDFIYGGLGNDTISGGAGNDRIIGHFGSDSMSGGTGSDVFYYDDVMLEPDYITDFETGIDILHLDYGVPLGRNAVGYGDLKSKYFQSSASSVAANSDVRFIYDTRDGSLYLDPDGSKSAWAPILLIAFTNKPVLVADDIYMS